MIGRGVYFAGHAFSVSFLEEEAGDLAINARHVVRLARSIAIAGRSLSRDLHPDDLSYAPDVANCLSAIELLTGLSEVMLGGDSASVEVHSPYDKNEPAERVEAALSAIGAAA